MFSGVYEFENSSAVLRQHDRAEIEKSDRLSNNDQSSELNQQRTANLPGSYQSMEFHFFGNRCPNLVDLSASIMERFWSLLGDGPSPSSARLNKGVTFEMKLKHRRSVQNTCKRSTEVGNDTQLNSNLDYRAEYLEHLINRFSNLSETCEDILICFGDSERK